jgi:peptidoglycan/LPS O-acetylase OafA/YrhL
VRIRINKYLMIVVASIAILLFLFQENISYSKVASNQINSINYNAGEKFFETIESSESSLKETKISFSMLINKLNNFDNSFQTADINKGIRMEISQAGKIGLIVSQGDNNRFRGFPLIDNATVNTWYDFYITLDKENHIIVKVNDVEVINEIDKTLQYDISKIVVGRGFDDTRIFNGQIKNFEFEYTLYEENSFIKSYLSIIRTILIILFLILLVCFIRAKNNIIIDTKKMGKNNYLDPLLALRAFACLIVVFLHCYGTLPQKDWANILNVKTYNLSWLFHAPAWVGVWVFFCLSGYLMGKAFYTGRYSSDGLGTLNFWKNRIIKIWPLYFFNLLVMFIFVSPQILKPEHFGDIFKMLTFTYQGDLSINPNGALWSISTEFQYYLIAPVIFLLFFPLLTSVKRIFFTWAIILLIEAILRYTIWSSLGQNPSIVYWAETIYKPLYINMDFFISGFLVNSLLQKKRINMSRFTSRLVAVSLILVLYVLGAFISFNFFVHPQYKNLFIFALPTITAIITFSVIYVLECTQVPKDNEPLSYNAIRRNPARLMEVFGILTFGIYVWHSPILDIMHKYIYITNPLINLFVTFSIIMILSIIISSFTYFAFEKSFTRFKSFSDKPKGTSDNIKTQSLVQ